MFFRSLAHTKSSPSSSLIGKRIPWSHHYRRITTPVISRQAYLFGSGSSRFLRPLSFVRWTPAISSLSSSSTRIPYINKNNDGELLFRPTYDNRTIMTARTYQTPTSSKIHLNLPQDTGTFSFNINRESADLTSHLLQENHEKHHIFFNNQGFHNHIAHHLLTLYAVGASPETIRNAYERNKTYQRPAVPANEGVVNEMNASKERFLGYLGKAEVYSEFLTLFEREIEEKGTVRVLNEYLFAGDIRAEAMFRRLFSGLLHPLIHLGFALEFNQPAILVEALAQTAVHEDYLGPLFLLPAEKAAGSIGKPGTKTMLQLLDEIRADKKLIDSVRYSDSNKFRDGVMKRAPDEMIKYASQFTVSEDQIQEKVAELINIAVYFTTASQRPPKEIKIDFFYMHAVTSSIFLSKIISLPFLDLHCKLRLMEWKGRMDLIMYVSRGTPKLSLEDIVRHPAEKDWNTIFSESAKHPRDDGHLPKLERAVAHGERVCEPYSEDRAKEIGLVIRGDMWLKIGNMVLDSVTDDEDHSLWVRSTGFEEAWKEYPDRPRI